MVDILNSIEDSFTPVDALVAVPQLQSLVDPGGGAAGDGGAVERVVLRDQIDLDGGVASAVDDLARLDVLDLVGGLDGGGGGRRGGDGAADGEGAGFDPLR